MPKSLAELEAAVREARDKAGLYPLVRGPEHGPVNALFLDAYAAAVRALTWAKAIGTVEGMPVNVRYVTGYTNKVVRVISVDDALTALRDAQERDK